ncbi:MAG: hypothetical protein V4484_09350 [Pseudomonadota bacterium]
MKNLLAVTLLCALAGCATEPPRQAAYAQPRDPSQWRVVSVTPVPTGTAARVAATSPNGKAEEYSSTPVAAQPVYVQPQPVYVPAPYAPQPDYYWSPVTFSLGFVFGNYWGGGHHYRGHRHR